MPNSITNWLVSPLARQVGDSKEIVDLKVAAHTEVGRRLFAEEDGFERAKKTGLITVFDRKEDAQGQWERRCRSCADMLPEHSDFFRTPHPGQFSWICRDCQAQRRKPSLQASQTRQRACNNRRARKHAAPGKITKAQIDSLWDSQQGRCHWCKGPISKSGDRGTVFATFHIEHIVPLSKGGTNLPDNIALSCPTCNLRKGAKMPATIK